MSGTNLVFGRCGSWDGNAHDVSILGLNLLCDVVHDVVVFLLVQQLITSHLQPNSVQSRDPALLWLANKLQRDTRNKIE